jgi:hypothetical protein
MQNMRPAMHLHLTILHHLLLIKGIAPMAMPLMHLLPRICSAVP